MSAKRQVILCLLAASAVTAMLWMALLCYAGTQGSSLIPVHMLGLAASVMFFFKLGSIERRMEAENGGHRRTNPEIHRDPHERTYAVVTGTVSPGQPTSGEPPRAGRERAVENTGIVLGEVEAYRCWLVLGDYLASMNGVIWLPSDPMSGAGVDTYNTSGVHAFKYRKDADGYRTVSDERVVGIVKLWGTIVEHETGYRAEFARPVKILSASSQEKKTRICARYGLEA